MSVSFKVFMGIHFDLISNVTELITSYYPLFPPFLLYSVPFNLCSVFFTVIAERGGELRPLASGGSASLAKPHKERVEVGRKIQ